MLSAADIKRIKSLKDKKFRDELGLFVVEGEKMVREALESSFDLVEKYEVSQIGEKAMERITHLSSPSSTLCVLRKPEHINGMPSLKKDGLYLALDSIRDPGNMGTILRIADWFGMDGVIATPDSVDIFNPKVVQSTMGAIFRVDFHYCDLVSLLGSVEADVYGTFLNGSNVYPMDLSSQGRPRIIVIGNESNGISSAVEQLCNHRITIPSFAKGKGSESLNAAVATAIVSSEFKRREL